MEKDFLEKFTITKIGFISIFLAILVLYIINNTVTVEYFSDYISLPLYTIIPGTLIILSIWALSKTNKIQEISKKSLIFLTISFGLWFSAEITWNLYEHVLDIDPYPSIADLFYISAPIVMVISLIIFLNPIRNKIKKINVFIASGVSILVLIPILIITFQANSENEFFEIAVAMIYPIVDTVLLIPAIIAILFSVQGKTNSFWTIILVGIIIFVVADDIFLVLVINDEYYDGHPVDILWLTSYLIWSFALYDLINKSKTKNEIIQDTQNKPSNLTKYGINIVLIVIISTTTVILIALNYFWSIEQNNNFILFFSLILVTLLVVFSSIIILLNSKLTKALEIKSIKINQLSNELIKTERLSAIGELAARLSHDLRNPLSVIKTSVEITALRNKEKLSAQDNETIQRINNAILRMTNQIDDVLNHVKTNKIQKNEVSINTCIKNAIESTTLPTKVKIKTPEKDVCIFADEGKLEIVFLNLLRNAIEAIDNKAGDIEIKSEEVENQIIIKFIDSGSGIKEDDATKIFEPLYTTKQTGTGLGLVSCKNIIEQHGGKISVKNNPTTFTITLPK